ncbi:hypothetical protein SLEP1_g24324 [Rubroshorea leprosula]|uniref:Uncharacterized protein n=1 Tax=Rubroshorea leprosula TaxID=152421 RepID=A0AAV5JMJ9_9ROSI|nr:hypothetical protein SLEP1_g24324 [Rubroshorea leprosula]
MSTCIFVEPVHLANGVKHCGSLLNTGTITDACQWEFVKHWYFCNSANGVKHWLLLTPASGSC